MVLATVVGGLAVGVVAGILCQPIPLWWYESTFCEWRLQKL
jgi:hypothetical protein